MKNYRSSEYLIQLKKKSFIMILLLSIVAEVSMFYGMYRELLFLIEDNRESLFVNSEFPPVLNAIIYELTLFLCTFFVFWGLFSVKYDKKENCISLRRITYDVRKLVRCQYEWGGIMLLYFLIIAMLGSFVVQHRFNQIVGQDLSYTFTWNMCNKLIIKIICLATICFLAISIGKLIAYLVKNVVWQVVIALLIDQVVIGKSWITTEFVSRVFADSRCFVTNVSEPHLTISKGIAIAAAICLSLVLYLLVIYLSEKVMVDEEGAVNSI